MVRLYTLVSSRLTTSNGWSGWVAAFCRHLLFHYPHGFCCAASTPSLFLEAQSTLSNPPHKTCQPDCNSVWLDKHCLMCNIYPCLLLCKIVCLWQHTYMQASSSSGKMLLDQHWDMFTALSWIKKPVWLTTNRFWVTQGSLGMMGKYHTYSSPQCENMRRSILPHYVTQKRNVHSCELSYTTDAPFQKVFQVMLRDAEII